VQWWSSNHRAGEVRPHSEVRPRTRDARNRTPSPLVEAAGRHGPERHMHPMVLEQGPNHGEPLPYHRHPLGQLGAGFRGHHLKRLGAEVSLVGGGSQMVEAPPRRGQQPLEVVCRQAVPHKAIDVVAAELEHEQPGTRFRGPPQGLQILLLGLFVLEEHVVKRAVDDGVEPILQAVKFGRVGNLEMDLSAIDMPVTYLAGTWDAITSAKQMRAASEKTSHSRYVELAATHFVPLQFPNRVSAELGNLVERCTL